MSIRSKGVNNKKGLLALESLLGILLSVMALLLLSKMFMTIFLQTPTNLGISQQNAESIGEFTDYFSSNNNYYSDMDGCFNVLKLNNLENFQIKEKIKENNYFYGINGKGVYIIKVENYPKLLETKNLDLVGKKYFDFGNNNNFILKEDKTYEGLPFSIEISEGFGIFTKKFGSSSGLEISNNLNPNYILLMPDIISLDGNDVEDGGFSNQNYLKSIIFENDKKIENEGQYLVFGKGIEGENVLFATQHKVSDMLVRSNLCSRKLLVQKDFDTYVKSLDIKDLDYINNELSFSCENEGNEFFEVTWKNGGVCKNDINCKSILEGNLSTKKTYDDFFSFIWDKCKQVEGEPAKIILKNFKRLNLNEVTVNSIELEKISTHNKELKFHELNPTEKKIKNMLDTGNKINGCERIINEWDFCKDVFVENKKAYFYTKRDKNVPQYYSFDEMKLSKIIDSIKGETKLYFLGKEITNIEEKDSDEYGSAVPKCNGFLECTGSLLGGGNDDYKLFKLKLFGVEGYDKGLDVFLTPVQVNRIPIIKEGKN